MYAVRTCLYSQQNSPIYPQESPVFVETALYICKRALHTRQRDPKRIHLCCTTMTLSSVKEPYLPAKEPCVCRNSPVYPQKSPQTNTSMLYDHDSILRKRVLCTRKRDSYIHPKMSPIFLRLSPIYQPHVLTIADGAHLQIHMAHLLYISVPHEPYISAEEPYVSAIEPHVSAEDRNIYICN